MKRYTSSALLGVAIFLTPYWTLGQTSETHEVETLESEELGPFEPDHRPNLKDVQDQIVDQTNAFRKSEGLEHVTVDETLQRTAEKFADFMAKNDKYGHRADDRSPAERAKAQGYKFCIVSENIAYQFKTSGFKTGELASGFVKGWKESPGHRENMLKPHITETGVAVAVSSTTGVYYAVQMFGRPRSEKIDFRLINKTEHDLTYSVAERSFTLPSKYSRTHRLCRPAELRWNADLEAKAGDDSSTRTIMPSDGDAFRIEIQDGNIGLAKATSADGSK